MECNKTGSQLFHERRGLKIKTITNYIESLFLHIPLTEQVAQLKKDLLGNDEDRYEDLKSQGYSENEAVGTIIAEFGNIDELLEEVNIKQQNQEEEIINEDPITVEEANVVLAGYRKLALGIASGVGTILVGVAMYLLIKALFFNRSFGSILGMSVMLVSISIGVALIIISGLTISTVKKIVNDCLITSEVKKAVTEKSIKFQHFFIVSISTGITFCILAVLPSLIFLNVTQGSLTGYGSASTVILVAIGVFLIIYGGVIKGSFSKFLNFKYFIANEDDLGPKAKIHQNKEKPKIVIVLEKIYWPCITLFFLIQGFIFDNWSVAVVLFPIAGIIMVIFHSIYENE